MGAGAGAGADLTVVRVVRETDDVFSFHLTAADGRPFEFLPGQFFTVVVELDGVSHRRAYSASSQPGERVLRLTVKRVAEGLVSNHLCERAERLGKLRVVGPSGSFGPRGGDTRRVLLVAGGSGVTPMRSIAQSLLENDASARVTLLLGNRSEADVVFREELEALNVRFFERFVVRHVWGTVLGQDEIGRELDVVMGAELPTAAYLCGPLPMMENARAVLVRRGLDDEHIREERFVSPRARAAENVVESSASAPVTFLLRGARPREIAAVALPGETLLELGLREKIDMPFSCGLGGCGACRVKLKSGDVHVEEPSCLSRRERDEGWVLTCVGRARGPVSLEVLEGAEEMRT